MTAQQHATRATASILLFLSLFPFLLPRLAISCRMPSSCRRDGNAATTKIARGGGGGGGRDGHDDNNSQTLTIRRFVEGASPSMVYDSCLCGWRDANFHLPIPHPITLRRGDAISGRGFRLMRAPPFLIERCANASYPHRMEYGVENPGPFTYQVRRHRGLITFEEGGVGGGVEGVGRRRRRHIGIGDGKVGDGDLGGRRGTVFTWHVEWEPLWGCGWFISPLTRWVVNIAANFTIEESERRRDGESRYIT
ncbi:hypothetical protein ACHAXA_001105 [Cyclostephanos tholiformis]|uniref:Uncharacterized protein n=1 Tax=Cyclostephanos tholiformis TaxID=382380 RepID=A0ABD3RD47_9STRA